MSYNIEGIIYPRQMIREVIKKVLPLYAKDYGMEYVNMILNRLYETIYIFDSNPIDTWDFVSKHEKEIEDKILVYRAEQEYKNYKNVENKIDSSNERILFRVLKKFFEEKPNKNYPLMDIDFNSYSISSIEKLKNGTEDEKNKIRERQAIYKQQCRLAGISSITIPDLATELDNVQQFLKEKKKYYLIKNTKWASRIKKEINDIYHFNISDEALKDSLFDNSLASTTIEDDKNNFRTIMMFPLMSNYGKTNLDHVLFHELRHVVETGNRSCGFYKLKNGKYQMINEIHTEKNALLDLERLSEYTFFGKSRRNNKSYYERFFPYLENIFEDYKMSFDIFSFINRPDLLERLFGERFLNQLEYKLNHEEEFQKGNQIRLKRNV